MFKEFKNYLESKIPITEEQFKSVEKLLEFKRVKRGEVLLRSGETCLFGVFVMKGCLRSYILRNGKEHILQFAPENWWIGDNNGIIKPEPALLNIDAVEDSKVALFDHEFINNFISIVPAALPMKLALQQNSYRSLQYRIIHLLSSTADERYSYFLSKYPMLANRIPLKMIASYLGMAPQSLSRVRAKFQPKNVEIS